MLIEGAEGGGEETVGEREPRGGVRQEHIRCGTILYNYFNNL